MKLLKTFVLCLVAVWLAIFLVLLGNQLSRHGLATKLKHAGQEIVAAIEIYWESHKQPPPDLESLKLASDLTERWNYSREGTGYMLTCSVAGFLDWKSSVLQYVRVENYWIQGWCLTDDNGEWE